MGFVNERRGCVSEMFHSRDPRHRSEWQADVEPLPNRQARQPLSCLAGSVRNRQLSWKELGHGAARPWIVAVRLGRPSKQLLGTCVSTGNEIVSE